jgi:hypothetical protein
MASLSPTNPVAKMESPSDSWFVSYRPAQPHPGISSAIQKRRAQFAMLSSLSIPHLMTESRGALPFRVAFVLVKRRSHNKTG